MRGLALAAVLIAACDAPREALPQRRDPGALVVAQAADVITLDPVRATDSESIEVIDLLFEGLVGWRAGSTDIEPRLATSWQVSEDGRTWTFTLRDHVRFHDGTRLDAEAVVFSFERLLVKGHPYEIGDVGKYWRSMLADVEQVKANGPLTVEIHVRRKYTPLLDNLAKFSIVSPTAVKKWGPEFAEHPIGTGPFVFEDWAKGSRVIVRRNLLYWGVPAHLNQIVFQVVVDARQRLINLESGSVDLATAIIPDEQPFVELHPDLVLHHTSGNNVSYLALNAKRPPFDDVRVRRAANFAVNKEPIVKLGFQGRATAADSPLPPSLWAYHSPVTQYAYDPIAAKRLLAEAAADGVFDPNRTYRLYAPSTPRPYLPQPERVARYIQASLAQAGIRTRLVLQPYAAHRAAVQRGEHDLGLFGWVGDTGDPDNFLMVLLSSKQAEGDVAQNIAFYRNAEVDQLLLEAQGESDTHKRQALYARIQDQIAADAPWVPIAHSELVVAGRVELVNVVLSPTGRPIYSLIRRRVGQVSKSSKPPPRDTRVDTQPSLVRTPTPISVTPVPGSSTERRPTPITGSIQRILQGGGRQPRPAPLPPPPQLRLRLRTKLVVAMALAALVPVAIVATIATGVILSSLETSLRNDADRQLNVGLNLILRSVERIGDETVQLSESSDLSLALGATRREPSGEEITDPANVTSLEAWFAREGVHVPSSRLQILDSAGALVFDRVIGGNDARFAELGILANDALVRLGQSWTRSVTLVAIGDRVVVRAVSPIVDAALTLRGVAVLSMPLDGDFADSIKGALSADVLIGGGTMGALEGTFRSSLGRRADPVVLSDTDRKRVLEGKRVMRDLGVKIERSSTRDYTMAATALLDNTDQPVGVVAVAVDRSSLAATKTLAIRSLVVGGLGALAFALVLALFWSRRLGAPIAELHRGAFAVSRGDLDHKIEIPGGDELTDLAQAFNQMTSTLKDNQARLAARMKEIVALHDAGRAVSSVIDLDQVSRKIVDAVARTFDVQLAALWLVDGQVLRASAARARRRDVSSNLATEEALTSANALRGIAERVRDDRAPVRLDRAMSDPTHGAAAVEAGMPGPFVGLPLERKNRVVGVLAVSRGEDAREFSDADLNLLTTFADQAGAAVENAVLYQQVRGASEELEKKVKLRTSELTAINHELGKALADLRETQAQLVLSERMAGLGLLVAGVAHEINSPSAAIRGSIDGLAAALGRVGRHGLELAQRASTPASANSITELLETLGPALADRPLPTGLTARKAARELAPMLEGTGDAQTAAAELGDLGTTPDEAKRLLVALGPDKALAPRVIAALTDHVYLHRTTSTVRHAVAQIQRIVGALKSYSHLDQQATRIEADLHEGLETTLVLLHHTLRDIVVERHYGALPHVPVFVDELNQVWTNLISNAQQALGGKGAIAIETLLEDSWAVVRVIDSGPGVPADVLPRIFEPFFTTKPKGEGTGLGLGISRQIVAKHGGEMSCQSVPGRTVFEVRLPIQAVSA